MKKQPFSIPHILRLGLALALMVGLLGQVTWVRSAPLGATLTDTTAGTATNDGTVNSGEYPAATATLGINTGFGDVIGAMSWLYFDSSSTGALNIGLVSGAGTQAATDAMVIYIDTDGGGAGFNTTAGFTDSSDPCRRAVSGYDGTNQSIINFASGSPGFKADYAICMEIGASSVYRLVNGGLHVFIANVNHTSVTALHHEMDLTLANLGLGPGSRFDYVATYLNHTNAYRSNEFQGVYPYASGNPGYLTVNLDSDDFHTFVTIPGAVSPSVTLGGDGPGGVGVTDGSSSLEVWLRGDQDTYTDTGCATAAANGNDVACWQDQSGNGNHVTQSNSSYRPTYQTGVQNGQPSLYNQGSTLNGDVLYRTTTAFTGDPTYSVFFAFNCTSSVMGDNLFAVGSPASADSFAYHVDNPARLRGLYHFNQGDVSGARVYGWQINSHRYFALAGTDAYFHTNGSLVASTNFPALSIPTTNQVLSIGGWSNRFDNPWGNEFTGYTGEAIFYTSALPDVERILVENYLSAKYASALTANDVYDGDTAGNGEFDLDVAGIGWFGSDRHVHSRSAGMVVRNATFLQVAGDWLLFGHKTLNNLTAYTELPTSGDWASAPNPARWARHWYIDVTDEATVTGGEVDIIFDYSEAGITVMPDAPTSNYRLLKRSGATGQFSDIAIASAVEGDQVQFLNVDVAQLGSNFTLGTLDNGNSPTLVQVSAFTGYPLAGLSFVSWQTNLEFNSLGFNLYRSSALDGEWIKLNAAPIPNRALGQPGGASYLYLDSGLAPGQVYYYWLEALNTEGIQRFGPALVTGENGAFLPLLRR